MGMPNTVKRGTLTNRTYRQLGGIFFNCKWCGNTKRRMYTYNGNGAFCDLECWLTYTDRDRSSFDYLEFG